MNLVWHIVKKDLRRLALPLTLWVAVLVGKIGIGLSILRGVGLVLEPTGANSQGGQDWLSQLQLCHYLLIAIEMVACYVLVAALIHEDPLMGTQVFWRTRPISGPRLLGAKMLGAALMFGALPLLVWLPWWLYNGYGWREMIAAAPETLGCNAAVVLTAMLVAVLTNNLTRFLTWTLVFVATLVAVVLMLEASRPVSSTGVQLSTGVTETRGMVELAMALGTMAWVVARQFLMRRTVQSFGVVLVGGGLIVLMGIWWQWDGTEILTPDRVEPRVEELPALTTNVLLTVDEAELFQPRARDPRENQAPLIRLTLLAHGVPKDLGVSYMKSEHTWQWPDGVTVKRSSGYADYGNDAFANSERALGTALGLVPEKVNPDYLKWVNAWSKARGLLPLKFRTEAGDELPIETIEPLTPSIAARMLQEPPVYSAVGVLALIKPEVQLELPLLDRDRHRFGANSLRITDTVVEDGKEHIALVESRATSWLDGLSSLFPLSFKPSRDRHQFVLVNHARGNLSSFHSDDWGSKERTRVGTVEIAWRGARFSAPRDWLGDGKWKDQENWFEGVTLAETTAHEVARFSREVKVAKLEVKPPVEANEDRR